MKGMEPQLLRIRNAINDPKVEFCIVPTPALKTLIVQNQHPHIVEMSNTIKYAMLCVDEGRALAVGKPLVLSYVENTCDPREKFILDLCDVRVVGRSGVSTKNA